MAFIRILTACLALVACAAPVDLRFADEVASTATVHPVFVATTRANHAETGLPGTARQEIVQFAQYDIAVPQGRATGTVPTARGRAVIDTELHFAAASVQNFDTDSQFRNAMRNRLRSGNHEAVVYVHGFNTTFGQGIYRVAQLSHDFNIPGVTVHYSWPTLASPFGYAYDRDSALFARDGLEALLLQLNAAGAHRIVLIAHSMGAQLLMETLRQMAIGGQRGTLNKIGGVVLISPDIDVQVFHSQAVRIGALPEPFVIFTSQKDRALQLSARLTGQQERLGTIRTADQIADLKVTLFETAAFSSGTGHFNAATSPALIRILAQIGGVNDAFNLDQAGRPGLIPGTILTVQNATQIILSPIAALGDTSG